MRSLAPGVDSHPVVDGEHGILEQYVNAISAARRTIYIEDQSLASASVIKPLIDALGGVSTSSWSTTSCQRHVRA
jgi:hypothetical protein